MEDWYRCKKNHIKTRKDIQYFQNIEAINCDRIKSCVYVRRYQRHGDRSTTRNDRTTNQETDTKNIILMDVLNNIHTFIFHWMPLRFRTSAIHALSYDHDESDDKSFEIIFKGGNETKQDTDTKDQGEEEETKKCEPAMLWPNGPKPMTQCNVQEMAFLLNHEIVDRVAKLQAYKDDIVRYIEDNALDGSVLSQLKRKPFANQLVHHFDDKKLRKCFATLHDQIFAYNNAEFVLEEAEKPICIDNSKFVSTIAKPPNHSELSYFALGQQYRYTKNLQKHPLYVPPRFGSLKEELECYFERHLWKIQKEHIATYMDPSTHTILTQLITQKRKYMSDNSRALSALWTDDIKEKNSTDALLLLIQINHVNRDRFLRIMGGLFEHLPPDFAYFDLTAFVFYHLLDLNMMQLNTIIKHNLRAYMQSISINEWIVLLNELHFILDMYPSNSIAFNENIPTMRQLTASIHEHDACLSKYVSREFFSAQHTDAISEVSNHYIRLIVRRYYHNLYSLNNVTFAKEANQDIINICCAYLESVDIIDICRRVRCPATVTIVYNVLYPVVKLNESHIYNNYLQGKCKSFLSVFQQTARKWSIGDVRIQKQLQCTKKEISTYVNSKSIKNMLIDVIEVRNPETDAHIRVIKEKLRSAFLRWIKFTIEKAVRINKNRYRQTQMSEDYNVCIQKADETLKMVSVKALKAVWYHGMNVHHQ
eukprot:71461_1